MSALTVECVEALAASLATAAMSFAVLAAVFVPLERAFAARPAQRVLREDLVLDACFFLGQYLVFAGASLAVLAWLAPHLALLARFDVSLTALGVPVFAQAALAVVLGDVVVYFWHRACHAVPLLWRFHAVHHSSEELDWLAAHREHPLDGLTTQLAVNLPGIALGVPLEVLAPVAVFRGMWAVFVHANVRLPLGPLRFFLGAPELHHWHHARDVVATKNFANLAPWLDVVFGTYERPAPGVHVDDDGAERFPLGVAMPWPKERGPRGWLLQLARPFRR